MTTYPELAAETRLICADAVDELDVAATLETHGVTDATAAAAYGEADVFALAERLIRDWPAHRLERELQPSPWPDPGWRPAVRGLLFALPAFGYLAVSGIVTGPAAIALLAGSLIAAWAAGQALAYLGHVRLGRGDDEGARGILRGGTAVAVSVLLVMTAAGAAALGMPAGAGLVAAGQVVYLLAATVPLVLGAERLLACALAPMVIAVPVGLVAGGEAVRSAPVIGAVCLSLLSTVAVGVGVTRGAPATVPTSGEVVAALPYVVFGLCAASLVLFVPLTASRPSPSAAFAALVPLSLSMGLAEWLLIRLRIGNHRRLQQTTALAAFAWGARLAVTRAVAVYAVALAVGCGLAGLSVEYVTGAAPAIGHVVAFLPLGIALFLALMLLAYGFRWPVIGACATAVGAELVLLPGRAGAATIQIVVTGLLCLGLFIAALTVLGRATAHR